MRLKLFLILWKSEPCVVKNSSLKRKKACTSQAFSFASSWGHSFCCEGLKNQFVLNEKFENVLPKGEKKERIIEQLSL